MKGPIFGDPWQNLFYGSLGLPALLYGRGFVFGIGLFCVLMGACMAAVGWLVKR